MRGHPTNSDFDSTTVYDGMGRRVQTTWQPMNSGVDNGSAVTLNYYYDPQVEFLELGLNDNGDHTWKVYGPDRSGSYGGAQGEGGLENEIDEAGGFANVPINNYFGDALGESYVPTIVSSSYYYTYGYGSALGGYGYEPGSVVYSLTPQWRGHYVDWTGFIYKGARYYDFQSGRFLSADPLGNGASMSLYDYANGDPVNGLDPDGRFGKSIVNNIDNDATPVYEGTTIIFSSQTTWGEKLEAGAVVLAAGTDIAINFTGVEGLADNLIRDGAEDIVRGGVEDVVDSGAQNIVDTGGQNIADTGGQDVLQTGGGNSLESGSQDVISNSDIPSAPSTENPQTLYHYTTEENMNAILESGELNPSLGSVNPNDVAYGNGQYLSDIEPGTMTSAQLSRQFLGMPFQGAKYTHYIEIDVSDLPVIQGRPGVFVVPNEQPLNLLGRVVSSGKN